MMPHNTTISIKSDTLTKLKEKKIYSRESYDEIINRLIEQDGSTEG